MPDPHSAWLWLVPVALVIGCQGSPPLHLGVQDGKLAPCPASPNCVSSQAADSGHRVAPLPFTGPPAAALSRMKEIVRSLPRTAVIKDTGTYLHIEFTSALFRFVDDVEFLVDDSAKVIHVRSASRLGRSDLGVNRKRVERIRALWSAAPDARP